MKNFLFTYVLFIFSSQLLLSQYNYDNFRFPDVTVKGLSRSFSAAGLQQSMIGHRIGQIQILRLEITGNGFSSTILQRRKNT